MKILIVDLFFRDSAPEYMESYPLNVSLFCFLQVKQIAYFWSESIGIVKNETERPGYGMSILGPSASKMNN